VSVAQTFCRLIRVAAGLLALLLWPAAAYGEVSIEGVDEEVRSGILAFIALDELPCDAPRWWVQRGYRDALEGTRRALETYGYYRAAVHGDLAWGEACWTASFDVVTGEPVRLGSVVVQVTRPLTDEPDMAALLANPGMATGERFTHSSYETAKGRVLDLARDLGYLDAAFSRNQALVDAEAGRADVELVLESGVRYRIGAVEIDQDDLRPKLFGRFLTITEGDDFNGRELRRTQRRLMESDYYDRVLVAPVLDRRKDGQVPVSVQADGSSRRNILLGAGYATDTGPRVRADMRYRRVNRKGHRFRGGLLASKVLSEANVEYGLPYGDPTHQWLIFKGSVAYEETDTARSFRQTVGAARSHRRGDHWTETNYVEYRFEDFDVGDQEGDSDLLLIGTSWSYTSTVDAPRALSGRTITFDVHGASKALASDTDFLKLVVHGKQIVPLGERFRLIGRISSGWTFKSDFEELPPSERFFAGGDNSVRGYEYESLGPEENDAVVGGTRLLTGSLELDMLIRPKWSVAFFVDSGSAFNDSPDFSTGVGAGLRWYSPVGPIRLDLAHPLDDPDNDFRIHISFGPDL
jgi:translocation and assembly module TamA